MFCYILTQNDQKGPFSLRIGGLGMDSRLQPQNPTRAWRNEAFSVFFQHFRGFLASFTVFPRLSMRP